jgi:hypothetical protein
MPNVTNIRIVDPYVLELIEAEQERSGEATPTKTAQRLIVERAAQREATEQVKRQRRTTSKA